MALRFVYDAAQFKAGWFENENGLQPASWIDRDLASNTDDGSHTGGGGVIPLAMLEASFFDDPDTIFLLDGGPGTPIDELPDGFPPTSGFWVQLVADFFDDPDLLFQPISIRALFPPDGYLKNEVRRIR